MTFLKRPWPFWAGCLLLVLLASILGRPDIPIDETRYVSVAWEMWSGGDWLVMHKNGLPYHHKPPLLFWLMGLGWGVFGVNDWWPRAISALSSFACLGLTVAIAHRLWPGERGVGERAGWLLAGFSAWLFFSSAVMFDVLLTVFVLLALLAALRAAQGEGRGTWGLFGVAIGLGLLAKGPVVFLNVLPVLLLAPLWGGRERFGGAWYGRLGLGLLLGAAIALAWAIPAAIAGGEEFRNAIFWGQTAGRMTGTLAHSRPFWFYLEVLPLLLFPWFFWGGAWKAAVAAGRVTGDTGVRFCLAWLIPAFVGFSLAGGKQPHYLLPLMPALALFLAFGLGRAGAIGRQSLLPLALAMAGGAALFILSPLWTGNSWLGPYVGLSWQIGGSFALALAVLVLFSGPGLGGMPRLAIASATLVAVVLLAVIQPLAPAFDTTPMAQRLKDLEERGIPVANADEYHDQYHLYGRLIRPLDEIGSSGMEAWFEAHPGGRVVAYLKRSEDAAAVGAEFYQPYLEGAAALLDAEAFRRLRGPKQ